MIKLYREGATHRSNGKPCQIRLFHEGAAVDALASGWARSVEDIGNDQQEAEEEKSPQKARSRKKRLPRSAVLELRQRAQEAGIPNWDSAPVDRIRRALARA